MKKTIAVFVVLALLSAGAVAYGWAFAGSNAGEAVLTETTTEGSREAAAGLTVGFRADSADDLHWINEFDFYAGEGHSHFKRGEMPTENTASVYEEIRFLGSSTTPFTTLLADDIFGGRQEKAVQRLYDGLQQRVLAGGGTEKGRIRLGEYLDFYPVSFDFQFGSRRYSSDDALRGMKLYEQQGKLSEEKKKIYYADAEMYAAFGDFFRIPVIEDEYQDYEFSRAESAKGKTAEVQVKIEKPLGEGQDYYEFAPMIVVQEENVLDGINWRHPAAAESEVEAGLKNRMLFTFNNRTAKGAAVDVSQIEAGYGIYELPFEIVSNATIRKTPKSRVVVNPLPLTDELKMVWPLDAETECVEISLSKDHRYLAVFSVKDGYFFAELVDADRWTSPGPIRLFAASEKMTYAWGEDGSLAATNHLGEIAILARIEEENASATSGPEAPWQGPYELLYSGKPGGGFDEAFFDAETEERGASYCRCVCRTDKGLVLAVKDGKAALAQNLLVGSAGSDLRNAALECAVIDESGILYRGTIKSSITDMAYDMSEKEAEAVRESLAGEAEEGTVSRAARLTIQPVRSGNSISWEG